MDLSSPNTRTGYRLKYYDALPLTTAGLILVLYVLAYLKAMEYIWAIVALMTAVLIVKLIMKKKRETDTRAVTDVFMSGSNDIVMTAVFAIICVITSFFIRDHVVRWWDDVNYWATDAKALYYLNGFTGKYGNVAPEFGDYPPAIQIAKWCILKLSPHIYKEGLAFVGYTLMNMIFMLPLMRVSDSAAKRVLATGSTAARNAVALLINIIWMIVIMLIPGIVNDVWSYGACADVTMGIVYGAMLMGIYETVTGYTPDTGQKLLPYIKVALYGAITALCKNTGFMWVTFAVILFVVLAVCGRSVSARYVVMTVLFIYIIQGSWWANCILRRRIAKLTGALARTAAGGVAVPDDASDKLRYYVLGFLKEPMHTSHTRALDISAFAMFVLIIVSFAVLTSIAGSEKRVVKAALIYSTVTGLAIYIIVLLSHMSIFAAETQYGSSEVMAISISRYGAPFTIGTFMLLICMGAECYDRRVMIWICAIGAFIALTTDYPAYGFLLKGYRTDRDVDLKARAEMIDSEGQEYIDYLETLPRDKYDQIKGHRVLFLRDGSRIHWVNDTYISYEVAPIATVYASYDEGMAEEEISEIIRSSHAEYVYRDGVMTRTD